MSAGPSSESGAEARRYTLATGIEAAHRLEMLQEVWGPGTRAMALDAGLVPGMRVADIGCGVGTVTMMFAELVGPGGSVIGVDVSSAQLEQARGRAARMRPHVGVSPVEFVQADAVATGLPGDSFDFVFCRFLLLHLPQPRAGLAEMRRILRPGGILYIEDADLASAYTVPPSAIESFGVLYPKLGAARGLDYRLGRRLHQLVLEADFGELMVRLNQPALLAGPGKRIGEWSLAEAAAGLIAAGLCTEAELGVILADMRAAAEDPNLLVAMPCMTLVAARKPKA